MKTYFLLVILFLSCSAFGQKAIPVPTVKQVENIILKQFGNKVFLVKDVGSTPYLVGDFNGDGQSDIAVLLNVEQGKSDIQNHSVLLVNTDSYSASNGKKFPVKDIGQNCLGLGILHGNKTGWSDFSPASKYLTYECFSSFELVKKNQLIRRGRGSRGKTPRPQGDSIILDLEAGGTSLIYWSGQTYKGFGLRIGD